eukprot:TRINITY_DN11081_c0_g2_i3.p1 TRINITY_DN11081_c0_g2~~TRINITY_DN11081_c0_g2_i3.p1  ORF type:complete len:273 (+),score=19.39 TRINITY_DN11081_c0_g2_i3:427-1245(+)
MQGAIAEGSIFDSDSDTSQASSCSDDASQGQEMAFGVTVLHRLGNVVSSDPAFDAFMKADLVGTNISSVFHDAPAVCAWLQMKVDSFQSTLPSSPRERTSGTYVLQRGKTRFDSTLVVCGVQDHEGVTTVDLTVRVGRKHRRKERGRVRVSSLLASAEEATSTTCVISINASASRVHHALNGLQDSCSLLFEPLFRQKLAQWQAWQAWWNECLVSFEDAPFRSVHDNCALEIHKRGSKKSVASVHLNIPGDSADFRRLVGQLRLNEEKLSSL